METLAWFIGILIVLVLLLIVPIRRIRRGKRSIVTGRFDFNGFKAKEISKRGVFDKTKWH